MALMRPSQGLVNASALTSGQRESRLVLFVADLSIQTTTVASALLLNHEAGNPFFWPNSTAVGSARPLMKLHLIYLQMFSFGVPSASTGW